MILQNFFCKKKLFHVSFQKKYLKNAIKNFSMIETLKSAISNNDHIAIDDNFKNILSNVEFYQQRHFKNN